MLKNKNVMIGDGLADIFKMLPYTKNILPKLATIIELSSIGTLTSNAINKNMNKKKDTIIKLNGAQVKKINDNFKKINDSKIFNKQITLAENQEGNGVFSFLLPTLVSMLPSLLSKGKGIKNFFF